MSLSPEEKLILLFFVRARLVEKMTETFHKVSQNMDAESREFFQKLLAEKQATELNERRNMFSKLSSWTKTRYDGASPYDYELAAKDIEDHLQEYMDGYRTEEWSQPIKDGAHVTHHFDEQGRIHNDDGPAIVFGNGIKVWSHHGKTFGPEDCKSQEDFERLKRLKAFW